jgi:multicomponent Na+:H+ antiporter subunit B
MMADVTQYFDYVLMAMLLAVGVAIIRLRNLFAIVMLTGVYSLLSAAWFTSLDALDVGFTEAAVGAGISTVLLLAAMLLTSRECDKVSAARHWAALAVCVAAGAALFYALPDMPVYGAADSPANAGVGMDYMMRTGEELYIPNVVTAILGSYRGFDTMGEVFVVFAAGVGVALLLGLSGRRRKEDE